jgi:hypothetical protein
VNISGVKSVKALALALSISLPSTVIAETVNVPSGTRVFIELDQRVTSKKKHNRPGSFVQAHVWRDVVVNGKTVVAAGTPVMVQIGAIKGAKVAGIKGHVELKAVQVSAVDGADLVLTGGYDKTGKSLMALSITLAAVVFVPLIFLKGKQAKLEPGTVFDSMVSQAREVKVEDSSPGKIRLTNLFKPLAVDIVYEELEGKSEKEIKTLPMLLTVEGPRLLTVDGDIIDSARVTQVNGNAIEPIPVSLTEATQVDESHQNARAEVDLKALGKHFTRGINRFTVQVGDVSDEVILDVEL